MTDLVDQMFPPIHRKWAPEFTDFNYWKTPVQEFTLPILMPPSPTLSARSDTSNRSTLARIRNFSLVSTRSSNTKYSSLSPPATRSGGRTSPEHGIDQSWSDNRSQELRKMTSFEKLSSMFTQSSSGSGRSLSPGSLSSSSLTYLDSGSDNEGNDDDMGKGHRRGRRISVTSMPGSMDDEYGLDDGGALEEGCDYEGEDEEEAAEEAFDEDFLATGEMKNVPFL
jgi:phosphatidate phosphatase LPIN